MRRDLRLALRLLVLPTLALGTVVAFAPGRVELGLRIYVLVLASVAVAVAVATLRRAHPRTTPFRRRDARTARERRRAPGALARIEQEVALGVASSFDLHHRLRPRLRRLASALLLVRRGISVDTHPERASSALGDATWALVRPDRPAPQDRQARGLPISELRSVVQALERL